MAQEDRRYFIITLPHSDLNHSIDVNLGVNSNDVRYSLDNSKVYIKTCQSLIDDKVDNQGISFETIFPSAKTIEYTSWDAIKSVLDSSEWLDSSELPF